MKVKSFKTILFFLIDRSPLFAPLFLAVYCALLVILILLGAFEKLPIIASFLISLAISIYITAWNYDASKTSRQLRTFNTLALLGAFAWFGFNFMFTSQHVLTNRDPATYAVSSAWLTDNSDLRIPNAANDFKGINGINGTSGGFDQSINNSKEIHAQGLHGLPALLGSAGKFTNVQVLLRLNVFIGAIALLSLYGLTRCFVRPQWALTGMVLFGATLPMLYFSRDTYTEPLTAAFALASLAFLYHAIITKDRLYWLASGILVGAGALARVDAYLIHIAMLLFLAIYVITASKKEIRQALIDSAYFVVGAAVVSLIAWMDISSLSSSYYHNLGDRLFLQYFAMLGLAVISLVSVYIAFKNGKIVKKLDAMSRRWRSEAAFIAALAYILILASRPLWFVGENRRPIEFVAGLQGFFQLKIEPMRDYAELTLNWVSWYAGPIALVLGGLGLCLLAAKSASSRKYLPHLAFVSVISTTSLLYLNSVNITPDQIWASRRLLPVVIPGIIIMSVVAADWLNRKLADKQWHSNLLWVAASLFIILPAVFTSRPYIIHRDTMQLGTVIDMCKNLPANADVLWVGSTARFQLPQTTNTFCDARGVAYIPGKDATAKWFIPNNVIKEFLKKSESQGRQAYIGFLENDKERPPLEKLHDKQQVAYLNFLTVEQTLINPPTLKRQNTNTIFIIDAKNIPIYGIAE